MKKVLFVLFTILLTFGACSDKDSDNEPAPEGASSKKLVRLEWKSMDEWDIYGGGPSFIQTFKYENGKFVESFNDDHPSVKMRIKFQYKNEQIFGGIETIQLDGSVDAYGPRYTATLDESKKVIKLKSEITSSEDPFSYVIDYKYENGFFLDQKGSPPFYEYKDNLLIKAILFRNSTSMSYITVTYNNMEDKLGLNIIGNDYFHYFLSARPHGDRIYPMNIFYQQGYYGSKSKYLVHSIDVSIRNKEGGAEEKRYTRYYSYVLNPDGYPIEITETIDNEGDKKLLGIYKLFYE